MVRAADFDDYEDLALVDATRTTGDAVAPADPERPATALFRRADLTSAHRVEAEVAREGSGPGEALLELRAGERLLAALPVPVTGDRHTWTTGAHQDGSRGRGARALVRLVGRLAGQDGESTRR